jgi:hypothetical protein
MISELEARAMRGASWSGVATRLPSHVRLRYESELRAMERYQALFDAVAAASVASRRALGRGCRVAARMLDSAAQRLLLPR